MAISKQKYGYFGQDIFEYTLDNECGVSVKILSFGGIIKNIFVKDKGGVVRDVVLGHSDFESYKKNNGYFGALVGRYANRLKKGEFEINEVTYNVGINDGENSLHGGKIGFDKKVWSVLEREDKDSDSLIMSIVSPDGEEGYPGTATVTVTYTLTKNNELKINYTAMSDKDTIFNMTNHAYFNLAGHSSGTIDNQMLKVNSSFYMPNNDDCMANGEVLSVAGTPFDFRNCKKIGQDINSDFEQLKMFGGYDHNFALDGRGMREAAVLSCEESGIKMTVKTDMPGIQIYSGNCIDEEEVCKDGEVYKKHQAICLETQYFPNSMVCSHFPTPILKTGEIYNSTTSFTFNLI